MMYFRYLRMNYSRVRQHPIDISKRQGWAAALLAVFTLLAACKDSVSPDTALRYRIVAGACGSVVFGEKIGSDSASAVAVMEARATEKYGQRRVTIELFPLEVVDQHATPPQAAFYALEILDAGTGMPVHSVFEVITTTGDLFFLEWCPD